jgi:hypothetical protein
MYQAFSNAFLKNGHLKSFFISFYSLIRVLHHSNNSIGLFMVTSAEELVIGHNLLYGSVKPIARECLDYGL